MPTYEYQCEHGHTFEEFQSIVAAPVEVCPVCGGKSDRKISGGTGLIFKGKGFYITDYARRGRSHDASESVTSPAANSSAAKSTVTAAPDSPSVKPADGASKS